MTYLHLEKAASSCAGSKSAERKPTCFALSLSHTYTLRHRERGCGWERRLLLLCLLLTWPLSSRHHVDHPPLHAFQHKAPSPSAVFQPGLRSRWETQSRSRRETLSKEGGTHAHTVSHPFIHTCTASGTCIGQLQSCAKQTGSRLPCSPQGLSASQTLGSTWRNSAAFNPPS